MSNYELANAIYEATCSGYDDETKADEMDRIIEDLNSCGDTIRWHLEQLFGNR